MKKILLTIIVVSLMTSTVLGFDGTRKGFILGGGVGPAYATFDSYRGRAETFGLQTAFVIGGGASDQITISYTGLQFWGNDWWGSGGTDEVGFALLPSVEVRYFLSPAVPTTFGVLGLGLSLYDDLGGEWNFGGGFSPHLGFGYEFASHYSVEVDMVFIIGPSGEHEPLFNIMILVMALAY